MREVGSAVVAMIERSREHVQDALSQVMRAMEVQSCLLDKLMMSLANEAHKQRGRAEWKWEQERSRRLVQGRKEVRLDDEEQSGEDRSGTRDEEGRLGSTTPGVTKSL